MSEQKLLTVESFSKHVGETFEIAIADREPYRMVLTEAQGTAGESEARQPFSLLFRAREEDVLTQATYRLDHPELGPLDIFIVPLGPERGEGGGHLYEAAFS